MWKVSELLDLAAAQPPAFAPGTSFSYSNTDYTLVALIIERITGHSWRHEVTRRVIRPLRLTHTELPAPGHHSIKGPHAHSYFVIDGQGDRCDRHGPSVRRCRGGRGASHHGAGPRALPGRTVGGPAVRRRATLKQMLTIEPAQGEGGLVGYWLGIERRALPRGAELIGHLGGAAHRSYVGRLHPTGATIAFMLNMEDDPTPLLLPVVQALVATKSRPRAQRGNAA